MVPPTRRGSRPEAAVPADGRPGYLVRRGSTTICAMKTKWFLVIALVALVTNPAWAADVYVFGHDLVWEVVGTYMLVYLDSMSFIVGCF